MRKLVALSALLTLGLTGCGAEATGEVSKEIDTLSVSFVPSAPAEDILTAADPLGDMLIEELAKDGYTVGDVEITVGTSYEAVGEALAAGTTDVALIPGGTFVLYEEDGAEIALTSTRGALSVDSDNPVDWNQAPTEYTDETATFYRSLIVAGPSEYGQELSEKVNNGEALTWEELDAADWCVQSPSSSAGYLYPSLWLTNNYDGKTVSDLSSATQVNGYGDSIARLSAEQCDVAPMYADARMDNQASWSSDADIWEATNVIGVTEGIYNDTISVSKNSDVYSEDFKEAIQNAFLNIASTEEGLATVEPYSHSGYEIGDASNYDAERQLQEDLVSNL